MSGTAQNTPRELVERAIQGCRTARETVWRAHRRWIAGVLVAHAPRSAEIEDLLQDVAVSFVRGIGGLADPDSLVGWLRIIAINRARSVGRRVALGKRIGLLGTPDAGEAADRAVDLNHEARQQDGERLEEVLAALERLPEPQREVLILRCLEGLSQVAIAERLGIGEAAVESRLARARRRLRQDMHGVLPTRVTGSGLAREYR